MPKIVIIGAGSVVFAQKLIIDLVTFPALRESTIALVDIDEERLELITQLSQRLIEQEGLPIRIEATTDRRTVLQDSDYVISVIQVGGMEAYEIDVEIPRHYNIDQTVGDTLGPGGIFRALRTIPVLTGIARDMEKFCPNAILLNYTNPMAILCWSLNRTTPIQTIGLCHSVQGTARQLAEYIGIEVKESLQYEDEEHKFFYKPVPTEIDFWVAGINHMAWFLDFRVNGQDAYPALRKVLGNPEVYRKDVVRFEVMKHFGYFVTESNHHLSEYLPYFRKNANMIKHFIPERWDYFEICKEGLSPYLVKIKRQIRGEEPIEIRRSIEYGVQIINAHETNTPVRVNVNVDNKGLISNLPVGCCVEVPCLVDRLGIHPCQVGDLPPQLASLNKTNIQVQEMVVEGILDHNKEAIERAVYLDPLCGALLTLEEIQQMVKEMFEAERNWLPDW